MSYVLDVTPDADSVWRALNVELQEMVVDGLDSAAQDPPMSETTKILDFIHERAGDRHYVFIDISFDHVARKIIVTNVLHYVRPLAP